MRKFCFHRVSIATKRDPTRASLLHTFLLTFHTRFASEAYFVFHDTKIDHCSLLAMDDTVHRLDSGARRVVTLRRHAVGFHLPACTATAESSIAVSNSAAVELSDSLTVPPRQCGFSTPEVCSFSLCLRSSIRPPGTSPSRLLRQVWRLRRLRALLRALEGDTSS